MWFPRRLCRRRGEGKPTHCAYIYNMFILAIAYTENTVDSPPMTNFSAQKRISEKKGGWVQPKYLKKNVWQPSKLDQGARGKIERHHGSQSKKHFNLLCQLRHLRECYKTYGAKERIRTSSTSKTHTRKKGHPLRLQRKPTNAQVLLASNT